FKPGVTVGQANAALAAAHAVVIGGLADTGILLAQVDPGPVCPLCDSFQYVTSGLASFRADTNVDFAAMSLAVKPASVPRGPGDGAATAVHAWTWSTKDNGGNWGLKDARFPQAWNLLESVRRKSPRTVTGIIDSGFDAAHPDLAPNLTVASQLCPTATDCRSFGNDPDADH